MPGAYARTMAAVAKLPGRLKEVLVLRTIEGMSQVEVAGVLGVRYRVLADGESADFTEANLDLAVRTLDGLTPLVPTKPRASLAG
mgnify:CR=1 FL=1